jgi:hypothetical protein
MITQLIDDVGVLRQTLLPTISHLQKDQAKCQKIAEDAKKGEITYDSSSIGEDLNALWIELIQVKIFAAMAVVQIKKDLLGLAIASESERVGQEARISIKVAKKALKEIRKPKPTELQLRAEDAQKVRHYVG